jgi:hypothetical protein
MVDSPQQVKTPAISVKLITFFKPISRYQFGASNNLPLAVAVARDAPFLAGDNHSSKAKQNIAVDHRI